MEDDAGDAGTDRLNLMRCSGGTRGVFGVLAVLRLKRLKSAPADG